jgi:hypothetical protein
MFFDLGRGRGGEGALTLPINILVLFYGISNDKFGQKPLFFNPIVLVYHQQQQQLHSTGCAMVASSVILRFRNIITRPIVPVNLG